MRCNTQLILALFLSDCTAHFCGMSQVFSESENPFVMALMKSDGVHECFTWIQVTVITSETTCKRFPLQSSRTKLALCQKKTFHKESSKDTNHFRIPPHWQTVKRSHTIYIFIIMSADTCEYTTTAKESKGTSCMSIQTVNSLRSRHIFIQSPTSQDGVTSVCLLSSLSCGESLQRAAIISFRTAEVEEVL